MAHQSFVARPGNILGILLILGVTLLQAFGFFQALELHLINSLREHAPSRFLPEPSRVVLISMEKTPHGFPSLDVAMVLRGLKNLSPRCIAINGLIESEQGPVSFLPTIQSALSKSGVTLIIPQIPSPTARFQSIPLIRYSLRSGEINWPTLEGKAIPGAGYAFLSATSHSVNSDLALPLLAYTSDVVPIGSLWWWLLPKELLQRPPLLLFGKFLFLSNHTPIHLTSSGSISPSSGEAVEMPLEDYLLQIEQKEQGTISPTFDNLWNKSVVLLGSHDDMLTASLFASMLHQVDWHHLSLWIQGVLALGWIVLLFLCSKLPSIPHRCILSAVIVILLMTLLLLLLHKGIIFPLLPGLCTAGLIMFSDKR